MSSGRADWRAVYRLQLSPAFTFRDALAVVPYLRDLGVSHLYLSPSLQATRGSTHGYDVVDPTRISEELGGEEAFRELASAGLGVLLDVVPNHMATSDENRFWRDLELRRRFFDWDEDSGWYRRFFDIGELGGVRVEDPEVFEVTHGKVLELVRDGLVQGLRIDHPDGLADPRGYLERLAAEGVEHVWVEKILEPGERLRDWPVEGTTGYEFANDVTALFVDPAGEEPLTRLYEELTGERRPFAEVAHEAKLEQARTTFRPEFERLRSLYDHAALDEAAASLHVYRTYVEPWSGRVAPEDREALAARARGPAARAAARGRRARRARHALPADDRAGDGEGRRGHGLLPLVPAHGAQRGRRRPGAVLAARGGVPPREPRAGGALPAAPARDDDARHQAQRRRPRAAGGARVRARRRGRELARAKVGRVRRSERGLPGAADASSAPGR